jgi:hypothetical protein
MGEYVSFVSTHEVLYKKGAESEFKITDKLKIGRLAEIIAESKRTPSVFIVKEHLTFKKGDGTVFDFGKNNEFLMYNSQTFIIYEKRQSSS